MVSRQDDSDGFADSVGTLQFAHEFIAYHARHRPDADAVVLGESRLSYAQLFRRANYVAHQLCAAGIGPECRVGLYIDRSLDMLVGLVGIMQAGAAYVPLEPSLPAARLAFLRADAGIEVFVTQRELADRLAPHTTVLVPDGAVDNDDDDDLALAEPPVVEGLSPHTLAYLIYTSGSTGTPKGVMIEHRSLLNFAWATLELLDVDTSSRVLHFCSTGFDASVLEIWMAFSAGAALYVVAGDARSPGPALIDALRSQAITHATFLPSTLAAMPRSELPSLRMLISLGEPLSAEICARWGRGRRLMNVYGPTEATVWATIEECQPDDPAPPIGRAVPGAEIRLVQPDLSIVDEGQPGELCVLGISLARGYLDRPEQNASKFVPDPLDPEQRMYRTGDLARRRPDGRIMYLGRMDHQLKIRGFRVEPGEIEIALAAHPGVCEVAVVGRPDSVGELRLCAYLTLDSGASVSISEMRESLKERLPDYMIPAVFTVVDELPRVASGKIDRGRLPAPGNDRPALDSAFVEPATEQQWALARIFAEVLDIAPVGIADDFFALGGDSLSAVRVLARIRREFGVQLPVAVFFEAATIAGILPRLVALKTPDVEDLPLVPRPSGSPVTLSFAQQGLWFLHNVAADSLAYHVPVIVRIRGPLDMSALGMALSDFSRRHEVVRTTYPSRAGRPAPLIGPARGPALACDDDLGAQPAAVRERRFAAICHEEFRRPFDIGTGPVMRTRFVRLSDQCHALVINLHHIVADGWSIEVMLRDLAALYAARARGKRHHLPGLPVQYADFAAWQRQRLTDAVVESELEFWRRELDGAPKELSLITDRRRPQVHGFRGGRAAFTLPPSDHRALEALCQDEGATLFMGLLAAFAILLRGQGASPDLVIGAPDAGRSRPEVEGLIGHFSNMLAIRIIARDDVDFRGLLREVRKRSLAALAHQELPFDKLVADLRPARNEQFQPLVQAVLAIQPQARSSVMVGTTEIELELLQNEGAPFDLTLALWERPGGGLDGLLLYSAELFDLSSAESMMQRYSALLASVGTNPDQRVAALVRQAASARSLALQEMAAALLEDPAPEGSAPKDSTIDDCAVRWRHADNGELEAVAFVVKGTGRVKNVTRRTLAGLGPVIEVPITSLPLTTHGFVDEDALRAIPVVDDELVRRWQARLSEVTEVAEVAAIVRERPISQPRLHIDELLPARANLHASMRAPRLASEASAPAIATADALPFVPAFADGGPLTIPDESARTLPEVLRRAVAARHRGIRYVRRDGSTAFQSYRALLGDALALLAGLARNGLRPGDRLILAIGDIERHFEAFWACLLGGFVPVTVTPVQDAASAGTSKLESAWRLLARPAILTCGTLGARLHELPFRPRVLVIDELRHESRGPISDAPVHTPQPDDVAFYQLTSGSTGTPKCIQETHRAIIRHIHSAIDVNGYDSSDVTLNWLPFDHVVPILMCHLKDVYVGCEQIHARVDRIIEDPLLWPALIETHGVTRTWSPNFGFKLISSALAEVPDRTWRLSSVRQYMNAGEQVTQPVIEEFLRVTTPMGFKSDAVQSAFGMAELCTIVTHAAWEPSSGVHHVATSSLGGRLRMLAPHERAEEQSVAFVDQGPPVAGVCLRIADADNQVVSEGVIGRLQIKGEVITPGYLDNEVENRRAFVGDGWFDTGDLGFLFNGRLTITGRAKEMIIVRGTNIYCHEVEDLVNGTPGVEPTFAAACAIDAQTSATQGTEGLAIFFVPRAQGSAAAAQVATAIRGVVTRRLGLAPTCVIPLAKAEFPKTTSGKIQRSRLKRAYVEGLYAPRLRELDLHNRSERTIPDAFHRHVWRRKETVVESRPRAGIYLLLTDTGDLGTHVATVLRAEGRRVVTLEHGSEFLFNDRQRAVIDMRAGGDYARVIREIGEPVATVVHLRGYGDPDDGAESLLHLIRALKAGRATPVRLLVVSSRAQATDPMEAVACAKAGVVGLVRTISEEMEHVDARHLDLPERPESENVGHILRELRVMTRDREVAYRSGRRLVAGFEAVAMTESCRQPSPFVSQGVYLITGGLGGIGRILARYLLRTHSARLIMIGRTELSAGSPAHRRGRDELTALAARHRGETVYEAVDVAAAHSLSAVVARAETRWGQRLDGVIHLAGAMNERLLLEEDADGLAAAMRPKLQGARALGALLDERPDALFLGFSSANAFLGGFSVGAYAAANRALDSFVHELRRTGHARSYSVAWSAWDEVGMSRGRSTRAAARARGYHILTPTEGLLSTLAALTCEPGHLIVGLEAEHPRIAHQIAYQIAHHPFGRSEPRHEVFIPYTTAATDSQLSLPTGVHDRFATPAVARLSRVERIPRTESGQVETSALARADGSGSVARREYVAPVGETESIVAAIWRDVLQLDRISVVANFFELGGHSLQLMRVRGRLYEAFGRDVAAVELFRYPSIRTLSRYLQAQETTRPTTQPATQPTIRPTIQPTSRPSETVQDRGRDQRRAFARQRRVARPQRLRSGAAIGAAETDPDKNT